MSDTGDEPRSATASQELSLDERAELERLRAEAAEAPSLRAEINQLSSQGKVAGRRRISWRTPVAIALIVVGCLLAPVSVLGIGLSNQVSNTSRAGSTPPAPTAPPTTSRGTDDAAYPERLAPAGRAGQRRYTIRHG